jgi:hypothetical protein
MDRSKRRELFWLFLIAGCVALFVVRNERHSEAYDRSGMSELIRETQGEPVVRRPLARIEPNDDLVTGSIVHNAALPVSRPRSHGAAMYYVPLGSYGSIDQATRRYLDVARHDPALEKADKLRIETVSVKGSGKFHKVRMGNFSSGNEAKNACVSAGIASSLCLVVAAR